MNFFLKMAGYDISHFMPTAVFKQKFTSDYDVLELLKNSEVLLGNSNKHHQKYLFPQNSLVALEN